MSRLSILGLYNFRPDIFDGLKLPSAPINDYDDEYVRTTAMSKEDFLNLLFYECAELSLYISSPDIFKSVFASWCNASMINWQKIYNTYFLKYHPIWNKDGQIVRTEKEERNLKGTSENENTTTDNQTDENTKSVAGFNSENFTNSEKNSMKSNSTTKNSSSGNNTDTGTIVKEYKDTEHGNIGTTMTQDMISKEIGLWKNNIYDIIISEFKNKFCLLVY